MKKRKKAFALLEVVMAIGIVAFAVLGVVALLPIGLKEAQNSSEEVQAIHLASLVAADLKNTPAQSAVTPYFGLAPVPWQTGLQTGVNHTFYASDGQQIGTLQADSHYRITLRFTRSEPLAAVEALLMVSWPASVDPFSSGNRPLGQVETYLTFPRP